MNEKIFKQFLENNNFRVTNEKIIGKKSENICSFAKLKTIIEEINNESYSSNVLSVTLIPKTLIECRRVYTITGNENKFISGYINYALKSEVGNSYSNVPYMINKLIEDIKSGNFTKLTKLDISKYFDNINRNDCKNYIEKIGNFEQKYVSYIFDLYDKINDSYKPLVPKTEEDKLGISSEIGIPQGVAFSNFIAIKYLSELDDLNNNTDFKLYRYVDDIFIIHNSNTAIEDVKKIINSKGLELNNSKELTLNFDENEDTVILGHKLSKIGKGLVVEPSDSSVSKMMNRLIFLKKKLENNPHMKDYLEYKLQKIILGLATENKNYGWLYFFKSINNDNCLRRFDRFIYKELKGLTIKYKFVNTYYSLRYPGRSYSVKINNFFSELSNEKCINIVLSKKNINLKFENFNDAEQKFYLEEFKKIESDVNSEIMIDFANNNES
ncbi:MAG: RNA-directed DNA polymerase [Mycoplasmatales bacterium]